MQSTFLNTFTRLSWTLIVTFFRHQGQAGWWDVHLTNTHELRHPPCAVVRPAERSKKRASRTSTMAGRRRGRGSNQQQQQAASQSQKGGPRRVNPPLSTWHMATTAILHYTIFRIIWKLCTSLFKPLSFGHYFVVTLDVRTQVQCMRLCFFLSGFD